MDHTRLSAYARPGSGSAAGASPPLRRSLTVGGSASRPSPGRTAAIPSVAALYRDERYSDLILVCQGKQFKVHRAIVCTQCPFFDRACSNGVSDSPKGVIDLSEDDPDLVDCVVRFLYTGRYSDGDPENDSPALEDVIPRPRSSHAEMPRDDDYEENLALAFALSSPYHGPSTDQPSVHSQQNLLALQSVPAWDDHGFRGTHPSGPGPEAESPWYVGSQFNYGGELEESKDRPPLKQCRGASRSLYRHLQVYLAADKYGIKELKHYAASRFASTAETRWGQFERFPDILDELFQTTPRYDPLREFTADLVAKCYRDVMFRSWVRPVLEKHNDLTLGVLDKVADMQISPRTPRRSPC